MRAVSEIYLDVIKQEAAEVIDAKQGDRATRFVSVSLMANGVPFPVPSEAKAFVYIKKPDGTFCYNECTVEEEGIAIGLTNQALAVAGTAYCDLQLRRSEDDKLITTASFMLHIAKSYCDESAVLSCNEVTAFDKKFMQYEKALAEAVTRADEAAEEARRAIEELGDVMGGGAYPVLHLAYGENVTLPVNTECRLTLEGACAVTLGAEEERYSSEWVLIVTQGETAYDLALPVIHWTLGIAPTFAAGTVTEIRLHYAGDTLEGVWNG